MIITIIEIFSAFSIGFAGADLNMYRYVRGNVINYNDPFGETLETVINAGERTAGLVEGFKPVSNGIGCLFGTLASIFGAIDQAEASGRRVVDVSVDFNSCSAAALVDSSPLYADDPLRESAEFAQTQLYTVAVVKFLRAALPAKSFSLTIYPTSSPAYPSTWRGR